MNQSNDLEWLKLSGYAEGISFLVLLLIAMPLKYWFGMPMAVRMVGSVHGALFIVYAVMVLSCARAHKWPGSLVGLGLLAAFLPLGPFWFDRRLRQG
jgi:integral membrane protein